MSQEVNQRSLVVVSEAMILKTSLVLVLVFVFCLLFPPLVAAAASEISASFLRLLLPFFVDIFGFLNIINCNYFRQLK